MELGFGSFCLFGGGGFVWGFFVLFLILDIYYFTKIDLIKKHITVLLQLLCRRNSSCHYFTVSGD